MIDRHIAFATASFVVSGKHGNPFQQGGLTRSIFTDDDGDGAIESQLEFIAQERQAKRIGFGIGDPLRVEPDPLKIRRRQVDGPVAS